MAAENRRRSPARLAGQSASMRPRRMAAENVLYAPSVTGPASRFNEAAAHGRGKPSKST